MGNALTTLGIVFPDEHQSGRKVKTLVSVHSPSRSHGRATSEHLWFLKSCSSMFNSQIIHADFENGGSEWITLNL